jgi:hypothetical protein
MRWLLFLSRLAFISGICVLIWLVISITMKENNELFSSTLITIGYVLGTIFLPVVNICYLIVKLARKTVAAFVPRWLIVSNIFFLLLLIFCIFYLNDPYYSK